MNRMELERLANAINKAYKESETIKEMAAVVRVTEHIADALSLDERFVDFALRDTK